MQLWPGRRTPRDDAEGALPAVSWRGRWQALPKPLRWLSLLLAVLVVWYGVIGGHRAGIDVDVSIRPTAEQRPAGGSATLGLVARLIRQQVDEREFVVNDPFFYPTAFARRTSAFQTAVLSTLRDTVQAMAQIGGSATMAEAAGELATPPTQWWLNGRWPFLGRPAEWHYRRAAAEIGGANRDLAGSRAGQGSFTGRREDRDQILRVLLRGIEAEVGRGDQLLRQSAPGGVRVQIAHARGTAYATTLLLRGLAEDNASAIRSSGRASRWSEALDALDKVVRLDPLLPGRQDLVQAGYSLLMAANAIRSILEG